MCGVGDGGDQFVLLAADGGGRKIQIADHSAQRRVRYQAPAPAAEALLPDLRCPAFDRSRCNPGKSWSAAGRRRAMKAVVAANAASIRVGGFHDKVVAEGGTTPS